MMGITEITFFRSMRFLAYPLSGLPGIVLGMAVAFQSLAAYILMETSELEWGADTSVGSL